LNWRDGRAEGAETLGADFEKLRRGVAAISARLSIIQAACFFVSLEVLGLVLAAGQL
jgi:hypothetical protein